MDDSSTAVQDKLQDVVAPRPPRPRWAESVAEGRGISDSAKRCFDISLSFAALVILSPLLLVVGVLIKCTSKGPLIFSQDRTGLNGKVFKILKFRSMHPHSEGDEVRQATRYDDRVTGIGRVIRRTSIDELPQLINILRGEMSIVGPRPHARAHDVYYSQNVPGYDLRFCVKPGLTGLAQVKGFRGETETLDKMRARVRYDLIYVRRNSLWVDLKIVLKTPWSLLSKNAY